MSDNAIADLARTLARNAEAVCRHYLPNGRREGRYWLVGDVANSPGRSLFVRLAGPDSGKGAAGKWSDAATGEHGDLLDLIALRSGSAVVRDAAAEARRFLGLPRAALPAIAARPISDRIAVAQRLFARSGPLRGTLGDDYLRTRAIASAAAEPALRFHPTCYYREEDGTRLALPALIAAVTDGDGRIRGVHRTWLDPAGTGKARVSTPRRAMGELLGHGVRFGWGAETHSVMAAGEGIETMLSLRELLPRMPMVATLSAGHLGALLVPKDVRRLYIAADGDGAGRNAAARLAARVREAGVAVLMLYPRFGDFNDDLRRLGRDDLRRHLRAALADEDAAHVPDA